MKSALRRLRALPIVATMAAMIIAGPAPASTGEVGSIPVLAARLQAAESGGDAEAIQRAAGELSAAAIALDDARHRAVAWIALAALAARRQDPLPMYRYSSLAQEDAGLAGDAQLEQRALLGLGGALQMLGDYQGAMTALVEASGRQNQDTPVVMRARLALTLSSLNGRLRRFDEAFAQITTGLELAREADDPALIAQFLLNQVRVANDARRRVDHSGLLAEALDLARRAGREDLVATVHLAASEAAVDDDDFARAERHALEALTLARRQGSGTLEAYALENLADAELGLGRRHSAIARLETAVPLFDAGSDFAAATQALGTLSRIREAMEDWRGALATSREIAGRLEREREASKMSNGVRLRLELDYRQSLLDASESAEQQAEQELELARLENHRLLLALLSIAGLLFAGAALVGALRYRRRASLEGAASSAAAQMLAFASHEIRNPVHGIAGLTELLAHSRLDERQRELVRTIGRAADDLSRLADDFLQYARYRVDRLVLKPTAVSIRELIGSVISLELPRAEDEGLGLSGRVDEAVPEYALLDRVRLRQVLLNLIGNAIRYSHEGRIEVRVRRLNADRPLLRFEVRDSGRGLSPDEAAALFRPFVQGSAGESYDSGSGLGLSISRDLVEAMGGRIGVDSLTGKGACFWFELPMTKVDHVVRNSVPGRRARGAAPPIEALVVDDDPVPLAVAVSQLRHIGVSVVGTTTPLEALQLLSERRFDVVLIDYVMPGLNGLELVRRVRARQPGGVGPRFVAISGREAPEEHVDGIDGWLQKPVSLRRLVEALERALKTEIPIPGVATETHDMADIPSDLPVLEDDVFAELGALEIEGQPAQRYLVGRFRAQLPDLLTIVRDALASTDQGALRRSAHRLRGTAAALGLARLAEAARRVEIDATVEDRARAAAMLERVEIEAQVALGELANRLSD